jgi:hypothetical protein
MEEQTIICPECGKPIPISQALEEQVSHRLKKQFEEEQTKREGEYKQKLASIEIQQKQIQEQKEQMEQVLQKKLAEEKAKIFNDAKLQAQKQVTTELLDLKNQNAEFEKKLQETQKNELELRKKARELEEQKKNLDLELQRKLDEQTKLIEEQVKRQAVEENRMKLIEKDKQMEILKKTIEDLKRQSEQGSMQIQGEAQEADLKQLLKMMCVLDAIEDVPTGIRGADLVQIVHTSLGKPCGVILWESKNTKAWSNDWIKKLKQDQASAKADICVLVSRVLPDGVENFEIREGVWIVHYSFVTPVVNTLRFHLMELNKLKKSMVGQEEKMEYLYQYLSGPEFKNRMENIVMAFSSMKTDLESEKRSMQRIWSKREKEIERVIMNTSAMYGDLQGIIGASLPAINSLELESGQETDREEGSVEAETTDNTLF